VVVVDVGSSAVVAVTKVDDATRPTSV